MSDENDEILVSRARNGSKQDFARLIERHYDMVYAVIFGILNQREQSLDVAQEVFIKLLSELKKFEGKSKFKTWLYRIAVNAAIDQRRKNKPMESIDMTDSPDEEDRPPFVLVDGAPSPMDQAAQSELRQKIDKALQKLSPEQRSVLVLREWQGMSYEEIAETLQIEVGTVMSRLFYAKKHLGDVLGIKMKEAIS